MAILEKPGMVDEADCHPVGSSGIQKPGKANLQVLFGASRYASNRFSSGAGSPVELEEEDVLLATEAIGGNFRLLRAGVVW